MVKMTLIVALVLAVVAVAFAWWEGGPVFFLLAAAVAVVGGGVALYRSFTYKRDFKAVVVPLLLDRIAPGLSFTPDCSMSEREFIGCELFSRPDRFSGKDLVEGTVGKSQIRFSLVHAEERRERTVTDSKGNKRTETYWETIFRGLLFRADFNKAFRGRTRVKPGSPGIAAGFSSSHVALESPEFNDLFTAYSTDQVEARYILTPSLMERVVALHRKFDERGAALNSVASKLLPASLGNRVGAWLQKCNTQGTCLSFVDSDVFVAIPMGMGVFEPRLFHPADSEGIAPIVEALESILGIVSDLDLNTRIWTKE